MILPHSVVSTKTGALIAQFAFLQDASTHAANVEWYVVIETTRLADFRRNIKMAAITRPVHEVRV